MFKGIAARLRSLIKREASLEVFDKRQKEGFLSLLVAIMAWWLAALVPLGLSILARWGLIFVRVPSMGQLWEHFLTPAGSAGLLSFSASFVVILLLPGFFLLELLFPPGRLSWIEKIPLSFIASLALLAVPGLFARAMLLPLNTFYWMFIGLYSLMALLWARTKARQCTAIGDFKNRLKFASPVLLLGVMVFIAWFPWAQPISNYDNWRYLAYIREDIDTHQLVDTDPVFGEVGTRYVRRYRYNVWLIDISLLSQSSGVDPIVVTTGYLKLAMGILSFLSIYIVAREFFSDRNWALFTVLIQMLYFASDRDTYYGVGTLLNRMAEDKIVVGFFFLPLLAFLTIRYLKGSERWQYWLLLTSSVLLMVVFNQIGIVLAASSILSFVFLRVLFTRHSREWILLVPIIITFILALPWPLYLRTATTTVVYSVSEASDSSQFLNDLVYIFRPDSYILHPDFIFQPLVLSSLVLALPLVFYVRKSITAQFLLSNVLCYTVLLFVPFITPLLGHIITPVMLWRVSWILPVALINSFWIYRLTSYIKNSLSPFVQSWRGGLYLSQEITLLLALLTLLITLTGRIERFPDVKWIDGNVPQEIADFLSETRKHTVLEGKVIAPQEINLYIPGFWGSMFVMYDRPSVIPFIALAVEDTDIFYRQSTLNEIHIDILIKHGVSHIVIPKNSPLINQFDFAVSFTKIYSDDHFALYRVPTNLTTNPLVLGDLHFSAGNWRDARSDFQAALQLHTNDSQAYLGLAQASQALGDMQAALTFYREALRLSGDDDQMLARIGLSMDIDPMYVSSYLELGDTYQQSQTADWLEYQWPVHRFLDHLNTSGMVANNPVNVRKTAFVIEKRPKGILFQHPPSRMPFPSFMVSEEHRLKFSLAIDPMAWQLGKGDGVQFDIYVSSKHTNQRFFSIYIDPKNVFDDRKWHDYEVDLSAFAGQTVTITFATSCGPNNNCDYDWAGWGEPRIVQPIAYNFLAELSNANVWEADQDLVRQDAFTIDYEARPILFQHPTSRIAYRVTIPTQARLIFGLGMDPTTWVPDKGDGVEYNVYVQRPNEPFKLYRLFQGYIDPKNNPDDRHWFDYSVDLTDYEGETVDIIFEARPGPAGDDRFDWGGWSMPVLISNTPLPNASSTQ